MRKTEERKSFRQDFRRISTGRYRKLLMQDGELRQVIALLEEDIPLPAIYKDHPLHGNWEGRRECHIRSDLLLVYRYVNDDVLVLERLGSHSEIFGL